MKKTKTRIDQLLLDKGLAPSRSRAQAFIMAGVVRVNEKIITKPGTPVEDNSLIEISAPPHPYVSRGGLKLEEALSVFRIGVEGFVCLDAGASTGGFTHCLLLKGARKVYAVDVGTGQLDWNLREDGRVVVLEKCNARYLTENEIPEKVDIITADLSFISLTKVIGNLLAFLKSGGILITLIKPQFEAERGQAKKGVIRDQQIRDGIVEKIKAHTVSHGMECIGTTPSPIRGPKGNVEYLGVFRKPGVVIVE